MEPSEQNNNRARQFDSLLKRFGFPSPVCSIPPPRENGSDDIATSDSTKFIVSTALGESLCDRGKHDGQRALAEILQLNRRRFQ